MRDGSGADVFNDDFHLRIVWKTSILLLKSKMRGMKMHNERRRRFGVFLKYVGCGFHYSRRPLSANTVSSGHKHSGNFMGALPYGSAHFFDTLFSLPIVAVRVTGRPRREACSPGRRTWFRVLFRDPFTGLATLTTPFVRLGLEPADILPGWR